MKIESSFYDCDASVEKNSADIEFTVEFCDGNSVVHIHTSKEKFMSMVKEIVGYMDYIDELNKSR